MNEIHAILHEAVEGLFSEAAGWDRVEANGLTMASTPEAGWAEAFLVIRAAGAHALSLPLPETIAAVLMLRAAGAEAPAGPLTLLDGALELRGDRLHGIAARVPWGGSCSHGVAVIEGRLVLAPLAGCAATPGRSVAGEPRDTLSFAGAPVTTAPWSGAPVQTVGALIRSAQMAGAVATTLACSVAYANQRRQFGKPIGRFQAIQQALAVLAEEAAAAAMAAEAAFATFDPLAPPLLPLASAKIRCGQAAGQAAAIAHQVHGAMGFTAEHPLQLSTRRLWSWRAEFGGETEWSRRLGRLVLRQGPRGLWALLTATENT